MTRRQIWGHYRFGLVGLAENLTQLLQQAVEMLWELAARGDCCLRLLRRAVADLVAKHSAHVVLSFDIPA